SACAPRSPSTRWASGTIASTRRATRKSGSYSPARGPEKSGRRRNRMLHQEVNDDVETNQGRGRGSRSVRAGDDGGGRIDVLPGPRSGSPPTGAPARPADPPRARGRGSR